MTKPANSKDKPSPADTPTHRPNDNGGKAVTGNDENYTRHKLEKNNIAVKHEREEHPVDPIKNPPDEKGMEKGKVQPG
jgi:hypothetical protein